MILWKYDYFAFVKSAALNLTNKSVIDLALLVKIYSQHYLQKLSWS